MKNKINNHIHPISSPIALAVLLLIFSFLFASFVHAARIKDLANLEGVRKNQLLGYGLVIGLNGTGDDVKKSLFTRKSIVNMVERLGISIDSSEISQLKTNNIAAVMVTADLPPFARPGSSMDIKISSLGDATSLIGGSLLMTNLKGPDGKVYAVAQGSVTVGAISYGGKTAKVQVNHPTVGRIVNGATIEQSVDFSLPKNGRLLYQLKQADFTTASRITEAVNSQFGPKTASSIDSGSIRIQMPENYENELVDFIANLENIAVAVDTPARIVVNERTGTIVMGQDVRISTVAVSHGNLNLIISEPIQVSQPNPLSEGETVENPVTNITAIQEEGHLVVLNMGVNIGDIANALNAIGATPRDLIAIFQAIKAAGALHGELVVL